MILPTLDAALGYHQTGRLEEADAIYAQLLQIDPHNADALHLKGVLAHQQGRHEEAIWFIEQAIARNPWDAAFQSNISLCYQAAGRLPEAVSAGRRALELEPHSASAMNNLGCALNEIGSAAEAEGWLRRAVLLDPGLAEAHNNLGNSLASQGKVAEALACYRNAVWLKPSFAVARLNLGNALREFGHFAEAREEYEAALRLDPRQVKAHYSMALIQKYEAHDPSELARIEESLRQPDLARPDRVHLQFAAGKICDDSGFYDRAFEHFRHANELRRLPFDRQIHSQGIDQLIAQFTRPLLETASGCGNPSPMPVFIVGMPRSGTSLVEQILASHPRVFGCGELRDLKEMAAQLWHSPQATLRTVAGSLVPDAGAIASAADEYLRRRQAACNGATRTTDKMPTNFYYLGLAALMFPNARVIHCRRDPLDVCLSCYFTNFREPPAYAADLEDLGFYYREYERLMAHWRTAIPLPILDVQYEELVGNQESVSRQIVDFCGLSWDNRCLEYHKASRPVQTCSVWQVRQPVYQNAVGRWKRYARHLDPLVRALGLT